MLEPMTDIEKRPVKQPSSSDPSLNRDGTQFDTADAHIGVKKVEAAAKIYRYVVIASANNINQVAGGIVFYAMGYTGLQVLTSIIVADITSLQYRGLVQGLTPAPFILNAFVSAFISESVLGPTFSGWKWGYGMFAILVPAALPPPIIILFWAEHTAYNRGYLQEERSSPFSEKFKRAIIYIYVFGLLLLSAGVALLLLPLTLAQNAKGKWHNPSMIAMIVIGLISLYLTYSYMYSFVYITQLSWSVRDLTYFANTQSVAFTVFAIMAGVIMRFTHRYKWLLALAVRLIGVGVMIHSRDARGGAAELVITQTHQ
ncbi:hypothetical protein FRB90_004916 [Tulasnella sp. 427]|nr:hypothetical protein FRB90_004916 [Tulasnella sp. 427]